ncbi:MAG: hypothetical protein WAW81_00275, partial [Minisyncoccia bacterium]
DFMLVPALSGVSFEELPQTEAADGSTTMNIRGNLNAVTFKTSELSNHLAREKVSILPTESVELVGLESLELAFDGGSLEDLLTSNEISFSVTGDAVAIWRTDEVALKADLAGRGREEVNSVLNNYPTIISATATIRPFWKSSFPSESSKISTKKLQTQ